jgi:hypothetical protein
MESPERYKILREQAFKPPNVSKKEDFKLLLNFGLISILGVSVVYYLIGFIYIQIFSGGWIELREFVLNLSFFMFLIFGALRILKFSMSQAAADPIMIFPMRSEIVPYHIRDLINLATSYDWDLGGLIGSAFVLLVTSYIL